MSEHGSRGAIDPADGSVTASPEILIELIYEGLLEDPPWTGLLEALRGELAAATASLIVRSPTSPTLGLLLSRGVAHLDSAYKQRYFASDPFVRLPEGEACTLDELVPRRELMASAFYRDFLEPAGVFHVLGIDLGAGDELELRLRLTRGRSADPFSSQARAILQSMAGHLRRALRLHARLSQVESERDVYAEAIDQLAVATICLDERGRVVQTNAAADRLLARRDGIARRGDRLTGATPAESAVLDAALSRAITARRERRGRLTEAIRLEGARGGESIGVLVRPLPVDDRAEGRVNPAVALFLGDPSASDAIPSEVLQGLFGLTPAEAQLATRLAAGSNLDEAAIALSIARNTARAQLRSIFEKTRVNRQADLVRLILRSVASLA